MAENVKANKAARAKKLKLETKVIGLIDTDVEKVLEYAKEGRELLFEDGEANFLPLPDSVIKFLSPASKKRYRLAENITKGRDVISAIQDGARGWAKDYNVRPGSYSDNTAVFGKDPNKDYVLSTPAKQSNKLAKGWVIDHDPNVHMLNKESGTLKTVGGENKPELILMSRPKSVGIELKKKKNEKTQALLGRTKEQFVEKANKLGVVASVD